MQRWMYEDGLCSLLTNFPKQQALITHEQGKIGRFITDEQRSILQSNASLDSIILIEASSPLLSVFPSLIQLPLFSFSWSSFASSGLLSVIPHMTPSLLSFQCYTINQYDVEQQDRIEAEDPQRVEDELKSRVSAENKAKKFISDKMKKEKKKKRLSTK